MEKRKRRKFTPECKAETVRLVAESGKTIGEVARDLDLTESSLRNWVKQSLKTAMFFLVPDPVLTSYVTLSGLDSLTFHAFSR